MTDTPQTPATDPAGPLYDPAAAAAGARVLVGRLERDGPTPGFDWELAISGLKKMIDQLEEQQ